MDGSSIIDLIDLTAENAEDEDDEKGMDMYARRRQRKKIERLITRSPF